MQPHTARRSQAAQPEPQPRCVNFQRFSKSRSIFRTTVSRRASSSLEPMTRTVASRGAP